MNNLTIIIPTHNREHYLRRVLDYYKDINSPIIIADSSRVKFSDYEQYENIKYFFFPNEEFHLKVAKVFDHVKTPYTLICADDDFIVPSAISRCVEFLENNSDHVSVQGRHVSFTNARYINVGPLYINAKRHCISGDTPLERLQQSITPYMQQFYSVHRTESLKFFFQNIHINFSNRNLGEFGMVLVSAINGKHKILSIFYSARDGYHDPGIIIPPDILEVATTDQYKTLYENFLFLIQNHLCQKTGCSPVEAKTQLCRLMDQHLKEHTKIISTRKSLKSRLFFLTLKLWYYLKFFVPVSFLELRLTLKGSESLGFPLDDPDAIKNWNIIKSFLIKHGLDIYKTMKH